MRQALHQSQRNMVATGVWLQQAEGLRCDWQRPRPVIQQPHHHAVVHLSSIRRTARADRSVLTARKARAESGAPAPRTTDGGAGAEGEAPVRRRIRDGTAAEVAVESGTPANAVKVGRCEVEARGDGATAGRCEVEARGDGATAGRQSGEAEVDVAANNAVDRAVRVRASSEAVPGANLAAGRGACTGANLETGSKAAVHL